METKKMYNPYTGKRWEVVIPDANMSIPKNAVIIIEDGEQKMVSRSYAAFLKHQGAGFINDPALRF